MHYSSPWQNCALATAQPFASTLRQQTKIRRLLIGCGVIGFSLLTAGRAEEDSGLAVTAVATPGYVRPKLADGSFEPETYAFGEGGLWAGNVRDDSIDRIKFTDIARILAPRLTKNNYLRATDPTQTKLLIMVYWGTTTGARYDPMARLTGFGGLPDGRTLDQIDTRNAGLLGYDTALAKTQALGLAGRRFRGQDLIDEVEDNRYFVVLIAYDFQILWKEKKRRLLWETRFSIPERGYAFNESLPAMIRNASRYFGQSSDGLKHEEFSEGEVKFGELKVLGTVP